MTISSELLQKCKNIKSFIGVYPADRLPEIKTYPSSLIMNTHTSNKPGEHWVAVYIDKNGFGEYFDSFGLQPYVNYFIEFLDENCKNGWTFNSKTIQGLTSINCGKFCVIFIWLRNIGISTSNIIKLFSNRDLIINDDVIDEFYRIF